MCDTYPTLTAIAEERGTPLTDLGVDDLKPLHEAFEADVTEVWDFEASIERRSSKGGTSKSSVLAQVDELQKWADSSSSSA